MSVRIGIRAMMIPQYLHATYRQLAGCDNNNNSDTNPVYNAMLRATKSSLEVAECRSRCNVLKSLKKQRIGTSGVESLATRMCRYKDSERMFKNSVKKKIVKIVMSEKLNDAYTEYRDCRRKDNKIWKESKKEIKGVVRREYLKKWRRYMKEVSKILEKKESKKVEWLLSKW